MVTKTRFQKTKLALKRPILNNYSKTKQEIF